MKTLRISPDLGLPLDVAGEAIAILAKRGAGKTNTATVLVEELHGANVQVVVLDPVGAWWGLRSSADGKSEGIRIPILGGQHGDVPLEPTAGQVIADVVVDSGAPLLLDLSDFPSKEQIRRFVTDFAERLYRRKARDRSLVHLVLEEADEFAPQAQRADTARMRGAIEQIVRRGRSRGLGVTLICQRSAVLNKDVLTQADVLIVMRTTGPHDIRAVREWIDSRGDEHADQVLDSIPGLATGEAWVWNPERDLLKRCSIRRRRTFDSSSTPKAGERRAEPRKTAAIDLDQLGDEIRATAERAKAEDPKELRRFVRELEAKAANLEGKLRLLERAPAREPERVVETLEVQVPVFDGQVEQLADAVADLRGAAAQIGAAAEEISNAVAAARQLERAAPAPSTAAKRAGVAQPDRAPASRVGDAGSKPAPRSPAGEDAAGPLTKAEAAMLAVLAQFPEGRTNKQLGVLAGYKAGGSSFRGGIAGLRAKGYATPAGENPIRITDAGVDAAAAAGLIERRPTGGPELYRYWLGSGKLSLAARKMLQILYEAPGPLTPAELAEAAEYEPGGSSYRGGIAQLRNFELVVGRDEITLSDLFYEQ
jgi:Helicase HerA, central domain